MLTTQLTDDVFKIGTLNCTIQFATSGILRFVGKTAEIHAELPNLDKETYGELIKKTSSEINLPTSLTADVGSLVSTIATFATFSDSKLAEMGIATSTIGNKKHISFDVSKIEKFTTKNPSNEQAVALNNAISSVIGAYKEFPKATLTKISESLSSSGLELERLNGSVIMLSLGIAKPGDGNDSNDPSGTDEDDPSGTDEEFEYEKVPGRVTKMILHYGTSTVTKPTMNDVKFVRKNYGLCEQNGYDDELGTCDLLIMTDNDGAIYGCDTIRITPGSQNGCQTIETEEEVKERLFNKYFDNYGDVFKRATTQHKMLVTLIEPIVDGKDYYTDVGMSDHDHGFNWGDSNQGIINQIVAGTMIKDAQCIAALQNDATYQDKILSNTIGDDMSLLNYIKGYLYVADSNGVIDKDRGDNRAGNSLGNIFDWRDSTLHIDNDGYRFKTLTSYETNKYNIEYSCLDDISYRFGSTSELNVTQNILLCALETGRAIDVYFADLTTEDTNS